MKQALIAERYARALYELAVETNHRDKIFEELRELRNVFSGRGEIHEFFSSPAVLGQTREQIVEKATSVKGMSEEVHDLIRLLAHKDRLNLLGDIVDAYQQHNDEAHGVIRGQVESAIALGPDERKRIEEIVKKVTKKDVILTYKTNPKVIGGLVAKVGSFTFDDTIQSHLNRMKEDLKRRVN